MNRFARNTLFSSVGGLCTALGGLVCAILAARVLGPTGSGLVVYVLWIVMLVAAICDLGLGWCLVRFLPELSGEGRAELLPSVVRHLLLPALAAAFGIPTALGIAAVAGTILLPEGAVPAFDPLRWGIVLALCVTQVLAAFFLCVQRGFQRFDLNARVIVVSMGAQIAGVAIGTFAFGVTGALCGYLAGPLLTVLMLARVPGRGPEVPEVLRRRLRRYAMYNWASNLMSLIVWSRIEVVFLQHWFGSASVGLFSVGLTLSSLAVQAPLLFTGGILAFFAERTGQGDRRAVVTVLGFGVRIMALAILPLSFGLAALTPEVVPLIYGKGFGDAIDPAAILIVSTGITAISTVTTSLVQAQERSGFLLANNLVGATLLLAGDALFIPQYGLMGAVACRGVVQMAMLVLGFGFVMQRLHFPLPLENLARLMLASAICGACARLSIVVVPGPAGLPLAIAVGAAAYFAAVRMLGGLGQDDLPQIQKLCDAVPSLMRPPIRTMTRLLVRA